MKKEVLLNLGMVFFSIIFGIFVVSLVDRPEKEIKVEIVINKDDVVAKPGLQYIFITGNEKDPFNFKDTSWYRILEVKNGWMKYSFRSEKNRIDSVMSSLVVEEFDDMIQRGVYKIVK